MRALLLAALGVALLVGGTAEAASQRQQPGQHPAARARVSAAAPVRARPAHHRTARARPARVPNARAETAPPLRARLTASGDRHAALSGPACRGKKSHCRSHSMGWTQSWTQGLPPAAGIQANECPDGTMATMARGHDDIVRCMPI